jgi:hypothetical protein
MNIDGELPFRSDRKFQLWHFGVSHSQLLLRSQKRPSEGVPSNIDLLFKGVFALQLKDVYASIFIRHASPDEVAVIQTVAPLDFDFERAGVQHYVLGERLADGWVQCEALGVLKNTLDRFTVPLNPPGSTPLPPSRRLEDEVSVLL